MARVEKIVQKMKSRPNGIRYDEAVKVLRHYGYELVRTKGSHRQFRNQDGDVITLKEQNPLKAAYVEEIIKRIGE
ncbi:type II toxin-antitoxin system HicA family toxin [Kyrpidia spormannii]|uniref:Type II toxin-antitoxin system HicA family toxin n=1 Tax=Kyrpidia spormannii TaxID=2055160 RepID=A0A6F9EHQ8_9BACL|nr:type II toxin-antitoxin system HicA family toxin [Kyrpidia spormannii]CAB3395949.1 conserved protein of unknown function [Kyrpidia spormannii]